MDTKKYPILFPLAVVIAVLAGAFLGNVQIGELLIDTFGLIGFLTAVVFLMSVLIPTVITFALRLVSGYIYPYEAPLDKAVKLLDKQLDDETETGVLPPVPGGLERQGEIIRAIAHRNSTRRLGHSAAAIVFSAMTVWWVLDKMPDGFLEQMYHRLIG